LAVNIYKAAFQRCTGLQKTVKANTSV